ncbi:hypothetical protein B4N84_21460 [Flavobacterium sp. IR1]|nr:hypothetical protein B4N84_21460 [Flavobacterium sp. IR1]
MYYFIKNYKTLDVQLKVLLLIAMVGTVWLFGEEKIKTKDLNNLKSNYAITTGKIEKYLVANLKGYKGNPGNSIKYSYSYNDEIIENSYYESYLIAIPDNKPDLSILHLVIYEKTNPKNSFILLNYPVTSPEDFERYKEMFKDKIPANAFKQD